MRLLIYEHLSAGGHSKEPVSSSVFSEGFGMLRTLVADAKFGGNTVTTILNKRIADFKPPLEADYVITVQSPTEAENALIEDAENADAIYIIAPETNCTLQKLVEKIEQSNSLSLNSESEAIAKAADKLFLQQRARAIGLSTPETISFSVEDKSEDVLQTITEKIGFPAVFKPADSVGCEGLNIVNDEKQAETAIMKIARFASSRCIAQQLIRGTAASVALISNGKEAQPIILNTQKVSLSTPNHESSYNGGTTPLNDEHEALAFVAAKKLVESIQGLKGYIGVDLILTKKDAVVIEVNPRLTTSYVGIRKALQLNMAQAIIHASLEQELPEKQETTRCAYFEKVKTPNPTNKTLQQAFIIPEVVSPPFPALREKNACALICTHGLTPQKAEHNFKKAKKQMQDMLSSGGNSER